METKAREKLIPLKDVPSLEWLPELAGGRRMHLSTVYHWVNDGRRGVKLQAIRSIGGLCTTEQWLWEFFERLGAPQVAAVERTPSQRDKAVDRAERMLESAGI